MVKDMPEEKRYVILGEGIFHAVNGIDKGFPTLNFFGANNWSMNKVRMLISLGIDEVVFFADNDVAGRKCEQYVLSTLQDWFKITTADISGLELGQDLGDIDADTIQECITSRYVPALPICLPDAKKCDYGSPCKIRKCVHWSYGKCNNLIWKKEIK
jgi:hypothetical protein